MAGATRSFIESRFLVIVIALSRTTISSAAPDLGRANVIAEICEIAARIIIVISDDYVLSKGEVISYGGLRNKFRLRREAASESRDEMMNNKRRSQTSDELLRISR